MEDILTITNLTAALVGIYEVLSRIIPTTKNWTLIGRIIEVLAFASHRLDKRKKK